jgi:hypothetical protein
MKRYITKAIVHFTAHDGYSYAAGGETVIESESTPVYTGLLDQNGTKLFRVSDCAPLGFDLSPKRKV